MSVKASSDGSGAGRWHHRHMQGESISNWSSKDPNMWSKLLSRPTVYLMVSIRRFVTRLLAPVVLVSKLVLPWLALRVVQFSQKSVNTRWSGKFDWQSAVLAPCLESFSQRWDLYSVIDLNGPYCASKSMCTCCVLISFDTSPMVNSCILVTTVALTTNCFWLWKIKTLIWFFYFTVSMMTNVYTL